MGTQQNSSPIGKRLKIARKKAKLTQGRLGTLADIDPSSAGPRINQYEKSTHTPTYQMVSTFAKILNVPTHYFYIEDDEVAEIALALNRISLEEIECILNKIPE